MKLPRDSGTFPKGCSGSPGTRVSPLRPRRHQARETSLPADRGEDPRNDWSTATAAKAMNNTLDYSETGTVAHELLHAVDVWHHGDADTKVRWLSHEESIVEQEALRAGSSFVKCEPREPLRRISSISPWLRSTSSSIQPGDDPSTISSTIRRCESDYAGLHKGLQTRNL